MPSRSKAQARWVRSAAGRRALGARGQSEWIAADRRRGLKRLPERKRSR